MKISSFPFYFRKDGRRAGWARWTRTQKIEPGEEFVLAEFFERFNAAGLIPMSLIHWQLTGDRSGIDTIMEAAERR